MKVLIIEDETAAYNNISNLLLKADPNIEIEAHLDTVVDSVAWLTSHPMPDLIFMDIQLADGSSFNIFECVTLYVPIIFTTAYDQYAIKAFEVNSIDYLMKPITADAVCRALDKFHRLNSAAVHCAALRIDKMVGNKEYINRVLIPYKDKILPIRIETVAYFYNTGGETKVVTLDKQTYPIGKSLDFMITRLNPALFSRVNRQFILSKEVIESITVWPDNRLRVHLLLPTEEPVFVPKNRAAEFKEWLAL